MTLKMGGSFVHLNQRVFPPKLLTDFFRCTRKLNRCDPCVWMLPLAQRCFHASRFATFSLHAGYFCAQSHHLQCLWIFLSRLKIKTSIYIYIKEKAHQLLQFLCYGIWGPLHMPPHLPLPKFRIYSSDVISWTKKNCYI